MRPVLVPAFPLLLLLTACGAQEGRGQDDLTAGWPQWQQIEAGPLPSAWRVEEASVAFDAWEASARVTALSGTSDAATIRFDDGAGGVLDIRMAPTPSGPLAPALAEGDAVLVRLIRREGFEGVAHALVVLDESYELLFLYDDGGYGAALYTEGERAGVGVERSLRGTGTGDDWVSREVTFTFEGESAVCAVGQSVRLGGTGLGVSVVVSSEWTGEPVTDVDLAPLAYTVFRVR